MYCILYIERDSVVACINKYTHIYIGVDGDA